ncbi:MAG: ABC transporter ATP-binding protein [Halobacteriales archaeon]|nr:ABC transporter ATP-binding protein [Halobacteriales archaeon]
MASELLRVRGLAKAFGGVRAVDAVDLDVGPGEMVGLIGPNGAGKTTLFDLVAGALPADAGSVRLRGEDVTGKPAHDLAQRGLARTFQIARALARMTVLENVCLAAPGQHGERVLPAMLRTWTGQEREVEARARETLEFLGLQEHADAYAGSLSGGQRKLLELGRAMMLKPRLMLLDEPLAGVNPVLAQRILERIAAIRALQGCAFLVIEHDVESVLRTCDRVAVMAHGKKIADAAPDDIRVDRSVLEAYLGAA